MSMIRLLDARRGLYRKCEELFNDEKIAESIYRFLCDGIDSCEVVKHERDMTKWQPYFCPFCGEKMNIIRADVADKYAKGKSNNVQS